MGRRDPAQLFIADLQGGGALGVLQIEKLIHLEGLTGQPVSKLFDAFYCASVGSILGAGLLTPHPARPGTPRYSARELGETFYAYLPRYLPTNRWHYPKQALSACLGIKKLHYDRTVMVETLPELFGAGVMMTDLLGSIVIPSGVLGEVHPYNFVNFRDGTVPAADVMRCYFSTPERREKRLEEMGKTLVVTAILASTAAPTVFGSFENPVTGAQHMDVAAVASPRHLVDSFVRAARRNALGGEGELCPVSFVQFGTGKNFQQVSSADYNGASFLGLSTRLLPDLFSMQVHQEDIEALEATCGPDRVHILDRPWNRDFGPRDILKADPKHIGRLREYAQQEIREQSVRYDRLAGDLVDNYMRKAQGALRPDAVFAPLPEKESPRDDATKEAGALTSRAAFQDPHTPPSVGREECIELVCPILLGGQEGSGGQDGPRCIQIRLPDIRIPEFGTA